MAKEPLKDAMQRHGVTEDDLRKTFHWLLFQTWMERCSAEQKATVTRILQNTYATLKEAHDAITAGEYSYLYMDPWTGAIELPVAKK